MNFVASDRKSWPGKEAERIARRSAEFVRRIEERDALADAVQATSYGCVAEGS